MEKQLTTAPHGHVLTNTAVWSPDSAWIVYDVRSDAAGDVFDGARIEKVNVHGGEVRALYESRRGACCGVATYSPVESKVAFILGPENPTPDWSYAPDRRQGVIVDETRPGELARIEARDLTPPFTPGALRGGTHVHVFSGDGQWISFTYNDYVLARRGVGAGEDASIDVDQRNVGVSAAVGPVLPRGAHPRNHEGAYFSVLATRTVARPRPGSDEIQRAFEDAWVGTHGYIGSDGAGRRRALAFQGEVVAANGTVHAEAFVVDLPDDVRAAGDGPLEGTLDRRPVPPRGTAQRRLTHTAERRFPGLQGPRHWLRSSPDGSQIGLVMKDDAGVAQIWIVSPTGGDPTPVTRDGWPVQSAFHWSPDGERIAYVADNSVFAVDVATGRSRRLTAQADNAAAPRGEACVYSPDGRWIAFVRRVAGGGGVWNQVFAVESGG